MTVSNDKVRAIGMMLFRKKGMKSAKAVNGKSGYEQTKKKPKDSKRTMLASALM